MEIGNITLIGSSHISNESVDAVKSAVERIKPEIIAIELDRGRLHALQSNTRSKINLSSIRRIGISGFIFASVGAWISKKLGNVVNMDPGSEMLEAAKLAKDTGARLALIDQNINITLSRLSKYLTFREKMRIFGDVLRGLIFPKRELEKYGMMDFELSKVPSNKQIALMLNQVKVRYPNIYNVIVHERNVVMARNLKNLVKKFPEEKIVAVVGAGHLEGMKEILKKEHEDQIYSFTFSSD